ncbi:hypothetical protein GUITHDRAFT_105499 [Guillardia theta CCMP2712]|uniref:Uncharacterized protein n=1 Tax=Guillardia theta (strain CCMP2712) TaxID=905079 RepID=L1JLA1_GUITC|nr:hypothetical protein GUITHDRAFT_105499 [Guillardia theta CCMP2712]EKX48875.1 hypothetical protein GUITHDRAFT_105499 [Guillardia theta CCMP2712]|mmetsp:Transcript_18180/g.59734  ORF Transcript_18180/g.59734 Transcript_18180/m.59734 type:complete len:148 (-) Transcript_18180:175-618(-)|eukprot:XP_005835855.1 hypothetical protein GUITHDRAFT_105499 [Guillardia theta CCMP2712]
MLEFRRILQFAVVAKELGDVVKVNFIKGSFCLQQLSRQASYHKAHGFIIGKEPTFRSLPFAQDRTFQRVLRSSCFEACFLAKEGGTSPATSSPPSINALHAMTANIIHMIVGYNCAIVFGSQKNRTSLTAPRQPRKPPIPAVDVELQ